MKHFSRTLFALRPLVFCALLGASFGAPERALAQLPFVVSGAREVALGGASLGVPDEAVSAFDNPATIGERGATATLGGVALESGDFIAPLKRVVGNDPNALATGAASNLATVRAALRTLADPGNGVIGSGRGGALLSTGTYAFSATRTVWGAAFGRIDLVRVQAGSDPATSIRFNGSRAAYRALTVDDYSLGASYSLVAGLKVGGAVHVLRGTASAKEESAFTTGVEDLESLARRGTSGIESKKTRFTYDVGALIEVGNVRLGAVAKAISRAEFPFDGAAPLADRGRSVTLGRQTRVGASVKFPVIGLLVAADADVTKNATLVDGLDYRHLGGGVEWTIGPVAIRGGVSVNLESPDKTKVFSAGAGVGLGPVHADAAAVYRPNEGAIGAVVTARFKI